MNTVIIETIVSVVANLAITLIAVFGAWLVAQIGKSQQLNTINAAVGELTNAAEQTVLELQQTVVDGLKEASADGKLTQDEIANLGKLLLEGTLQKMSDSGIGVLKAANVDIKGVSRWARNTVDALKTIRLLNDHFVHVIFEQEDVDTRTPGHLFKLNLSCAVAQAESESISENLKWLYRKRAERGIFKAVSWRYFGFNTDDGNFTPDENAKYVRQMFQEYVSGKTLREIAKGLEGVKNNKGKQVSASQVKSILANEVYKGDLHICKSVSRNVITGEPDAEQYGKYIEGHHEAIVGADLWAKAQKRLEAEARPRKDKSKEIDELEMDILAMAEDGWPLKEIAERLGTSVDVVRTCEKKLKAKGWLKEEMSKKQEIETRIETVYQAVKEGHQVGIGSFLGMKSGEVRYALTKLEKAGRVRKEDGAWVVA